jgi:hypothetical protein
MLNDIITKQKFLGMVESLVNTEQLTYMEAILHICDERGIDPLDIGKLISPHLKEKVEVEAMQKNMIPQVNSLEFEE